MSFTSVIVQPAYGNSSVIVTWAVTPGEEDADFFIYRSPTGLNESDDWTLLNENTPVNGQLFYTDATFYDKHDFRKWHYRVLGVMPTYDFDSPIISTYGSEALRKTEYGALYTMRRREYLRMRMGNGIRVFHCIPSTSGTISPNVDPVAGKNMIQCSSNGDLGTSYLNAFNSCFQTWAEIQDVGPQILKQMDDGGGFDEDQSFKIRLLAFPQPESGHVIIQPASDIRYILEGNIQPFLFKGFLPVAYEADAKFLSKADPRYKLEMPTMLDDPSYPVRFSRAL